MTARKRRSRDPAKQRRNARRLDAPEPLIGEIQPPVSRGTSGVSKFKPEFCEIARKMTAVGATEQELADYLEVTRQTLYVWASQHEDFFYAIKVGRNEYDLRVERSLASKAVGYTYDAEKVFCNADGEVTRVTYREHVPPDTVAAIFWLSNRKPDEWKRNRDALLSGGGEGAVPTVRLIIENAPGNGELPKGASISDKKD